ncbi:LytTR family transcriptional regulator [Betaproteobacteria bacterium GR16-43]|nr:LytTR family transcriptional regulator [Betaproteobacteria bacterium GR16-43]
MDRDPRDFLQRYLPRRRYFEVAFWVVFYAVGSIVNTKIAEVDVRRAGLNVQPWAPAVWEWSSHMVGLALIPALIAYEGRFPLHFGSFRKNLPWHVLGTVAYCAIHVVAMVALRKAFYAWQGAVYDSGNWLVTFFYEYLKDFRSYIFLLLIVGAYRLFMLRLQGEATLLDAPDSGPPEGSIERPERFLVKKLGKEFLLPAGDIEWMQAMGNYVNLRVRGRDYPLRSTMAAIEERVDATKFVRVHRSYIVNLDQVVEIEPTDGGDATIKMKDGAEVPCSRRYRDGLRRYQLPA